MNVNQYQCRITIMTDFSKKIYSFLKEKDFTVYEDLALKYFSKEDFFKIKRCKELDSEVGYFYEFWFNQLLLLTAYCTDSADFIYLVSLSFPDAL